MKNKTSKLEKAFLKPEVTLLGKLKNIVFGAVLYILWSHLILWLYKANVPEFMGLQMFYRPQPSQIFMFISMCVFAPLFEEIIYRLHLSVVKNIKIKGLLPYAVILSSVLFGLAHGGKDWSVPIQGVAGLIFCYVYIKNGYSYISSVTMHFFINLYFFLR